MKIKLTDGPLKGQKFTLPDYPVPYGYKLTAVFTCKGQTGWYEYYNPNIKWRTQ